MILKCDCHNTSADYRYGAGWRPHVALVRHRPKLQEYLCAMCYWVRTESEGRRSGGKKK